jgi:hypothetical protein
VIVALLFKLVFIESCQVSNSLVVFYIVFFLLYSHLALLTHQSVQVVLVLFSCLSQSTTEFVDFSLSLFKFVAQPFEFSLMQVLQLFLILSVSSNQVVFSIFIFCFDHVQLVIFLVFNFLDLVFEERDFSVESLVFKFRLTSHVFNFKILLLNLILKLPDVEFLQFVVAEL